MPDYEYDDPDFGNDEWLIELPVWIPVATPATTIENGQRKMKPCSADAFCSTEAGQDRCLPVFTDDDLAERFIAELETHGVPPDGVVAVPFHDEAVLISLLEFLHRNNYDCLQFDSKGAGQCVTFKVVIPKAIESLRNRLPPSN